MTDLEEIPIEHDLVEWLKTNKIDRSFGTILAKKAWIYSVHAIKEAVCKHNWTQHIDWTELLTDDNGKLIKNEELWEDFIQFIRAIRKDKSDWIRTTQPFLAPRILSNPYIITRKDCAERKCKDCAERKCAEPC